MSKVILTIGSSSSVCGACGGNADPWDKRHIRGGPRSMWSAGSSLSDNNGCGAVFTHISSPYNFTHTDMALIRTKFNQQQLKIEGEDE